MRHSWPINLGLATLDKVNDDSVNLEKRRSFNPNFTFTAIQCYYYYCRRRDCLNRMDEAYCRISDRIDTNSVKDDVSRCPRSGKRANLCDGIPECDDFYSEECYCNDTRPEFCDGISSHNGCSSLNGDRILEHSEMCDGNVVCREYADERGCINRFYCTDQPLPNIPIENRCDRKDDCINGADEINCTHFYCNDEGHLKYIKQSSVCDGIQDCVSSRDECQPGCIKSAFSDEKLMIKDGATLVFVWIFSVTAILGCGGVIFVAIADFVSGAKKSSGHTKINKVLILNLSVSDFLVGVYTLSICIKASNVDGEYCVIDREWRCSATCSALGAILVIGSEQSVLTMVLITAARSYSVWRPFSQPNLKFFVLTLALAWMTSLFLGLVPLFSINEDYFVSSITISANKLFKIIDYPQMQYLNNWLSVTSTPDQSRFLAGLTQWGKLEWLINNMNSNIKIAYKFGYYSSHSVCLPTFFPDRNEDVAWAYSLVLLLINFSSFLFMLIANILLYRKVSNKKVLRSLSSRENRDKQNTRMQRKITRILLSDFLCWMPVCIMGFLQLGGVKIPNDAYLPTGLLIIPINSALNPFLYSDVPDKIWQKVQLAAHRLMRKNENTSVQGSETAKSSTL